MINSFKKSLLALGFVISVASGASAQVMQNPSTDGSVTIAAPAPSNDDSISASPKMSDSQAKPMMDMSMNKDKKDGKDCNMSMHKDKDALDKDGIDWVRYNTFRNQNTSW